MHLIQNWPTHNLIGHPLMQILIWLHLDQWADAVHDNTLPVDVKNK